MSNALLKSNTAMPVWVPVSKEEKRSCMVVRSCVSHEKPALKPWLRHMQCNKDTVMIIHDLILISFLLINPQVLKYF